jgi:hypothetical protein
MWNIGKKMFLNNECPERMQITVLRVGLVEIVSHQVSTEN